MKKKRNGTWSIFVITLLCIGMIYFFSTVKQNDEVRISRSSYDTAGITFKEDSTEETEDKTVHSYPYYGMNEDDLNHCLLGKPMIISECSNFDKLPSKHRIKYYYFGYSSAENSGKIIVRYGLNDGEDDGYVDSGYYIDQQGDEYQIDYDRVVKVEEKNVSQAEAAEKKSGGKILPGSKDNGNSSTYGKTSSKKSTSSTTEFDPDDHDIEGYYEDNRDDFDSIEDAYDAFEDDEDAWDDY